MAWILLIIALGLAAGLLVVTVGYTKSIIALLITLLVGLVFVVWYTEVYEERGTSLIDVEDVTVDNFQVRKTYGDSFEMFARIRNGAPDFTLTAVGVELSASDCVTEGASESCVIVGQQEEEIQIDVPAGQARDIKRQFIFPPMRPSGTISWGYQVVYTKARK